MIWADEDWVAELRRKSPNPQSQSLPGYFRRFDFGESEQKVNDIVHAADTWAKTVERDGVAVPRGQLAKIQDAISHWVGGVWCVVGVIIASRLRITSDYSEFIHLFIWEMQLRGRVELVPDT